MSVNTIDTAEPSAATSVGVALLQEAAGHLDRITEPDASLCDIMVGLDDSASRFHLHKASKRYWKTWHATLVERAACVDFLSGGRSGARGNPDLATLSKDIDMAQDTFEAQWQEATSELSQILQEDENVSSMLKNRLSIAQTLFEERKRAEAELVEMETLGKYSEARDAKRQIRLELQAKEEELRKEAQRIESEEIAAAKFQLSEISAQSKTFSQNTLMKKLCFEESAEALQLFLHDTETVEDNLESFSEMEDTAFVTQAGAFLRDPEKEKQKHKEVFEIASARLMGELAAAKSLSNVRWLSHDPPIDPLSAGQPQQAEGSSTMIAIACILTVWDCKDLLPITGSTTDASTERCLVVWPSAIEDTLSRVNEAKIDEVWDVRRVFEQDSEEEDQYFADYLHGLLTECLLTLYPKYSGLLTAEERIPLYNRFLAKVTAVGIPAPIVILRTALEAEAINCW